MTVLVAGLVVLTVAGNKETGKEEIASVMVKNGSMLQEADYLKYAFLDKKAGLAHVTLPIIKDRIEKHPYIKKADVEFTESRKVKVSVEEKTIKALIQKDNETFFITDKYEILPVYPNTNLSEVPLITNLRDLQGVRVKEKYYNNEISEAFRIINGFKYIDNDLYKSLSTIDLKNGGDIVLGFNCFNGPVIFGKGDDARKIVYLESLYKNFNNQISDSLNYIDLRYSKFIYIGKMNG
jgi:cell division protein FtsQ